MGCAQEAYGGDAGRKTAVHAEELAVHDGGQRQGIEGVHAQVVQSSVVLVQACACTIRLRTSSMGLR